MPHLDFCQSRGRLFALNAGFFQQVQNPLDRNSVFSCNFSHLHSFN